MIIVVIVRISLLFAQILSILKEFFQILSILILSILSIFLLNYVILFLLNFVILNFFFFLRNKTSTFINQLRPLNQPKQIGEYLVALLPSRQLDFDSKLPS